MQFQVRDLLLATTLVAVYAAALVIAPPDPWESIDWLTTPLPVLVVIPFFLVGWRSNRRRAGRVAASFRPPQFWWAQFSFAGIALVTSLVISLLDIAFPKPVLGQFVAMHLMFFFLLGDARLGEHGVVLGPSFLPWEENEFEVQGEKLVWRFTGRIPKFMAPTHGSIKIPAQARAAVVDALQEATA